MLPEKRRGRAWHRTRSSRRGRSRGYARPGGALRGHAGFLYLSGARPAFVNARAWETLGNPEADPSTVAAAVAEVVDSCIRHGV